MTATTEATMTAAEWVNVKDGLPPTAVHEWSDHVLVWAKGWEYPRTDCVYRTRTNGSFWRRYENDGVTHWMPIPSPPADEVPR